MKRQIRLREFEKSDIINKSPSVNYVSKTRHLSNEIYYRAQTDLNGYIVSGRKFNATKNICIIGASLVENMFVRESRRWNTYLEKMYLQNGHFYRMHNAGYSGATSLNVLNTLLNKVFFDNFDSIIYIISSNDYSATAYQKSYWNLTKNHSNLFLEEYEEEKRYYNSRKENHFDALIKSTYTTAVNFNQDFWLATYPNLSKNSALDKLNTRLRFLCEENSFNLIDIDLLIKENNISYEENFYDDLHLSENGTVVFSKILYDFFERKYTEAKSYSQILTKRILNDKFNLVYENSLTISQAIYSNSTFKKTSFNILFDINNIESKIKSTDEFIVKFSFDNDYENPVSDSLLYTEDLGWHFYIVEPFNKKIETSYSFEISFKGSIFIEIKSKDRVSTIEINSIDVEIIQY